MLSCADSFGRLFGRIDRYRCSHLYRTSRPEIGRNGGRYVALVRCEKWRNLNSGAALTMASVGAVLGVGWASLGTFASSLIQERNPYAAMGIKAVFLLVASFVHGYIRLSTPRLFLMVLLMIVPVLIGLACRALLCRDGYIADRG